MFALLLAPALILLPRSAPDQLVEAQSPKFDVQFEIDNRYMTYITLYITIQNLQDSPDDISLKTILYDTDFSIFDVHSTDFAIERKEEYQENVPDYGLVEENYTSQFDNFVDNGDWFWDYAPVENENATENLLFTHWYENFYPAENRWSWTESQIVGWHLEDRERWVWKSKPLVSKTEDGLKGELKHQWEETPIGKFGTPKGTLKFKFKFYHPIVQRVGGWGSKGIVALDLNGENFVDLTGSSWWDTNWQYRMKITIDSSKVDDNLDNFPVTIFLDNSNFDNWAHALDNGDDFRFTDNASSIELDYERERHDSENENAEYHVRIPSVSSTENTDFYLYLGNSSASDGANPTAVWDSNFTMVQHMVDNTTISIEDSTSNDNDGTKTGAGTPAEVNSKIAKGQNFAGEYQIDLGDALVSPSFTVSFWCSLDTLGLGVATVTSRLGRSVIVRMYQNSVINIAYREGASWYNLGSGVTPSTETYYYVTASFNGTTLRVCVDGVERNSVVTSIDTEAVNSTIGSGDINCVDGQVDEVCYSSVARSAAWIKASYNSGNDSLVSYGSEETSPEEMPGAPVLYLPPDGSTLYDETPYFEWENGENADNHRLLVDNDSDFSSPEENRVLAADNYYTIADENSLLRDNYSWKVIAINENGENESSIWTFLNYLPPNVLWSYHDPSGYAVGVGMAADASSMAGGTEATDKLYFWGSDNDNVPEWTYTNPDGTNAMYVEMSDNGKYIVATFQNSIRLFENSSSTPIWSYTGLGGSPHADISADGTRIVGSEGGDVWLWGNADNTPIWSYKQGSYSRGAHVSADGNYVIAVFMDYIIKFTDSDNTPIWTYETPYEVWKAEAAISDNGSYAVVAAGAGFQVGDEIDWGCLYLFSEDNNPIWTYNLTGPPNIPYGLDITASGHRIVGGTAAGINDTIIEVFNNQDNVPIFTYDLGTPAWAADIHDSGEYLAVGSGTFSPSETGYFWFFAIVENVLYNKYNLESLGWDLHLSDDAKRSFASSDHTRKFFYFETDFTAPDQPTPVIPENDAQIFDNTPTFEWTRGTGATSHRLLIDNDNDFSSTNENRAFVVENTYTIADANSLPSDNYFWKVIAVNFLGENESSVFEFELILREWNLIETWSGTIEAPSAWQLVETWTGAVEAPAAWTLIETWSGTVEAPAAWQLIETWTGTIEAVAQWSLTETWSGTVQTPSGWQLIETWSGTIEAFAQWELVETWSGAAEAPAAWVLIESWSGTIQAPAEWNLIENWTGTIEAPANWDLTEMWTGTINAPIEWNLIETWSGTVEAPAEWQLIETWTGAIEALATWRLIETWTGIAEAPAQWNLIENWTGTVYAFGWKLTETWTGGIETHWWVLVESWSGSIQTPAVYAVSVSITPAENSGILGNTLTYTVIVVNIGGGTDNYDLASSDALGWVTYLDNDNFLNVPLGENRTTTLNVALSTTGTHEIIVTATGTGVSDSDNCTAISATAPEVVQIGDGNLALAIGLMAIGMAICALLIAMILIRKRREEEGIT